MLGDGALMGTRGTSISKHLFSYVFLILDFLTGDNIPPVEAIPK